MKKKFLITGGSGFVGKSFTKYLSVKEREFIAPTSDVVNLMEKTHFNRLNAEEISCVVHLAAKTFVPDSWNFPGEFFDVNVLGTKNVLEFCRINKKPLIYLSSYLYGIPKVLPICENADIMPNNPYAFSKKVAENMCEFYAKEFGLRIIVLRPFNIFGPYQNSKFLIPHIIKQAIFSDEIVVQDTTPKRDYLYIDNLLDAIYLSIEKISDLSSCFSVFNVGAGYSESVLEIINNVQKFAGTANKIITLNQSRENEIDDVIADTTKIKEFLGWEPCISFEQGLINTIDFYRR